MVNLDEHPTVIRHRQALKKALPKALDAERLRRLCLEAGADDVGFVSIGRAELDDQREDIVRLFPWTKALVSLVCRMNREPVRSPARSVANLEFHHTGERINEVAPRSSPRWRPRVTARLIRPWASRWRWTDTPARSGWSPTSRSPWRRGLGRWASTAMSFTRSSATSSCWTRSWSTPRFPKRARRLTTTRAWSASSAWRPAPWVRSAPTDISTSRPATRTTTESSWAGLAIG